MFFCSSFSWRFLASLARVKTDHFPLSSRRFAPLAPEAPVVEPRWGSIIRMIGNPACATRRWALESNAVGVKVRWARHASPLRIGGLENPPSVISCASCSSMFIFRSGFTSLFTLPKWRRRRHPLNDYKNRHKGTKAQRLGASARSASLSVLIRLRRPVTP